MDAGGGAAPTNFLSPLPPALTNKPTTQRPDTRPDERNEKQQDETTNRDDKPKRRTKRQEKTPQAKRQAALQENRPRKPRPTPISITLPTRTSGATHGANNEKTTARNRACRTFTIRASYLINIVLGILLPHIASLPSQTPQLINKPRPT